MGQYFYVYILTSQVKSLLVLIVSKGAASISTLILLTAIFDDSYLDFGSLVSVKP